MTPRTKEEIEKLFDRSVANEINAKIEAKHEIEDSEIEVEYKDYTQGE